MVDLTIVVPLYNGLNNIDPLLGELVPELNKLVLDWEILFIDDHSQDKAYEYLECKNSLDNRIRCIRLKENRGQQNAVFCGLINSKGNYIITMDDDLQHPVELIGTLLSKINEGYDIVYAVNRSSERSWILGFGTWFNGLFFKLFLKKPKDVEIGSYRILTRELVDVIKDVNTKFVYISALIFTNVSELKVCSFNYIPVVKTRDKLSRINLKSRFILFLLLFNNYGPFKSIFNKKGEPFLIERSI